jgi:hypothetical protein
MTAADFRRIALRLEGVEEYSHAGLPAFRVGGRKFASLEWEDRFVMKDTTKRSIVRSIHIIFSIPILGYIYSPFEELPDYARPTRFVFLPVMVLTGLWMWKGHVLRRLFSKRSA